MVFSGERARHRYSWRPQATVVGCLEGGATVLRFDGLWRIHAPLSGESVSATSSSNFTDLVH